jgi:hypothetical protein
MAAYQAKYVEPMYPNKCILKCEWLINSTNLRKPLKYCKEKDRKYNNITISELQCNRILQYRLGKNAYELNLVSNLVRTILLCLWMKMNFSFLTTQVYDHLAVLLLLVMANWIKIRFIPVPLFVNLPPVHGNSLNSSWSWF